MSNLIENPGDRFSSNKAEPFRKKTCLQVLTRSDTNLVRQLQNLVVERRTMEREVRSSIFTQVAVLCP